jgi:HEPN domain-containing protein
MREEVKRWWKVAIDDLETSKYNLDGNKLAAAAFYAQQSVEKGLKTLLISKNKKVEKTHDITKLSILVSAPDKIIKLCSSIHPIYFESRYPDRMDFEEFSNKTYIAELVNNAEKVIKWVKKELKKV